MSSLPLDRSSITALVHQFYDQVRADPVLGPVFNDAIGDHWDTHLARMVEFWSTVMLSTHSFEGNVFGKHMALSGIEPDHFRRWLALFQATAVHLFEPAVASEFQIVANRIASSLQYGYFGKVIVDAAPAAT
ncbi:group III truncated hemoglobin [Massilia horti]|uniref:Group III truncated hemoglobin n=1 Tax=Massilia horti TaxID=2562153 RepID=A0A4Y9SX95_9BURK|nr:group III truncated hemoglobin [Massilia horti]TFW31451.1 group III truncated hemoglobin [Massilia horti]TFW31458.1 group III truncated hemoglobin [Massilia horti]